MVSLRNDTELESLRSGVFKLLQQLAGFFSSKVEFNRGKTCLKTLNAVKRFLEEFQTS